MCRVSRCHRLLKSRGENSCGTRVQIWARVKRKSGGSGASCWRHALVVAPWMRWRATRRSRRASRSRYCLIATAAWALEGDGDLSLASLKKKRTFVVPGSSKMIASRAALFCLVFLAPRRAARKRRRLYHAGRTFVIQVIGINGRKSRAVEEKKGGRTSTGRRLSDIC